MHSNCVTPGHFMVEPRSAAWLLLAYGDQRSYAGNIGYADDVEAVYKYDSFVQNHKRIREGDIAVLRDKGGLVGLASVARIVEAKGAKTRQRCPRCNSSGLTTRKVKRPPVRCSDCNHEFEEALQEEVDCTTFAAYFDGSFISARGAIGVDDLRHACSNYHGQLAMQPISVSALIQALGEANPAIANLLELGTPGPSLGPDEGDEELFVPGTGDEREKTLQAIRTRRGQRAFREAMRTRYGDRCVVTGCTLVDVLEAAHISPYRGQRDNHPANGLLLRADIHTLFDLDLLAIEPSTLRVHLRSNARLAYPGIHGSTLVFRAAQTPSESALRERWERCFGVDGQDGL
jgi:putative restriction endonuclease